MDKYDIHEALPFKLMVVLGKMNKILQTKLDQHFLQFDLTSTEFMVLDALWTHKKLPIQQIGTIVLITSGAITHVLNSLIKKGYVKRSQSEEDKRVFYAELTEEGKKFWINFVPRHQEIMRNLFSEFDQNKLNQLTELIKELGLYIMNR